VVVRLGNPPTQRGNAARRTPLMSPHHRLHLPSRNTRRFGTFQSASLGLSLRANAADGPQPVARLVEPAERTRPVHPGRTSVPVQVIAGPVTEVLGVVRLAGTTAGLALVHVALGLPFAVLVLRNALADVPAAQLRRARLTGRRELAVLWRTARSV